MSEEKKDHEGSCCKTESKCCGCKKFFLGVLAGLALAVVAHCLLCGHGGYCGKMKTCPITHMQMPAQQ
jgi:hypothetical protein